MNRIKLITSKEYWVEALENKEYNNINNIDFAKDIISKIEEAINFTDSSLLLKDKKILTFMQWVDHNNIQKGLDYYVGFGKHWSFEELSQKYNNDKKALIV